MALDTRTMIDMEVDRLFRQLTMQVDRFLVQHVDKIDTHELLHYPERMDRQEDCILFTRTIALAPKGTTNTGAITEEEAQQRFSYVTTSWKLMNVGDYPGHP